MSTQRRRFIFIGTIISSDNHAKNTDLLRIPLLKDVFERYPITPINIDVKENNDELIKQVQYRDVILWFTLRSLFQNKVFWSNNPFSFRHQFDKHHCQSYFWGTELICKHILPVLCDFGVIDRSRSENGVIISLRIFSMMETVW